MPTLLCKMQKKMGKNGSYLVGELGNCLIMVGKPDQTKEEYHVYLAEKTQAKTISKPEKEKVVKENPVMPPVMPPTEEARGEQRQCIEPEPEYNEEF